MKDKMREARLRQFEHVQRRCAYVLVRRSRGYAKGKDRAQKYWEELIRQDMTQLHISEDMTLKKKNGGRVLR